MNRALNILSDVDRTSIGVAANTSDANSYALVDDFKAADLNRDIYYEGAYLGGLSTSRCNEQGFSMTGSAVNQAVLECQNAGNAGDFYVYVACEQILTIDGTMNAALIR
jgi:hypothetical protein